MDLGGVISSLGIFGPIFLLIGFLALWSMYFVGLNLWLARRNGDLRSASVERGLKVLFQLSEISPIVGLLGTVGGLWSVFTNLGGVKRGETRNILSMGLGEALSTTIVGLALALLFVFAHLGLTLWHDTARAKAADGESSPVGEGVEDR